MKRAIIFLYKAYRNTKFQIIPFLSTIITKIYFQLNGIKYDSIFCSGIPHVHISLKGECIIGKNLVMVNWIGSYASGLIGKCRIEVRNGAYLKIGNFVGMSVTTIVCHESITIKDNVNIGVGVHIYDTDFHSINWESRQDYKADWDNKVTKPITIEEDVFIGAHSIILKGVTIGARSIIGAGSVVTKNIPSNVIAAGNPCKIIKNINDEKV